MLDMVRLAREIPRRAQGKGRKASVALEPLAMGSGTGDGFTWTAAKHQRLTLFKRAGRNIGDEAGARIAHRFGIFWTCGRFNDTVAEGLHSRIGSHQRHIETSAASHKMALGDHVRLDDFDPGRPFHGAEVLGGDLRLFGRDALGDIDHLTGITLSLIPTGPGAGAAAAAPRAAAPPAPGPGAARYGVAKPYAQGIARFMFFPSDWPSSWPCCCPRCGGAALIASAPSDANDARRRIPVRFLMKCLPSSDETSESMRPI